PALDCPEQKSAWGQSRRAPTHGPLLRHPAQNGRGDREKSRRRVEAADQPQVARVLSTRWDTLELLKALIDVPDGRLVALDSVSQNVPATLQFSLKVSPFLGTQFLYIEMRYHKSTHC